MTQTQIIMLRFMELETAATDLNAEYRKQARQRADIVMCAPLADWLYQKFVGKK